jgi:5,10-methylenetetrahydromethanopterin reductase
MRIGISLNDPSDPDAFAKVGDQLRQAADQGFASAWMSNIFNLDALTTLAVAGSQVPGIEVGTAVVPTYPRHPAALAQQARTTALAVPGGLTLGIGLSHQIVIENMYGYDFGRPLRHMREYLDVLVPLLNGEAADVTGETISGHISLSTPNPGRVPLVIAALGPKMLKLAAERTDGTVLWMTGPKTVREHVVPAITEAARAAGRPDPRVVCVLPVCVTADTEAAYARAGKIFEMYGLLPSYKAMLDREGVQGPGEVAVVGDEDAVTAQIEELAKGGVTDFVAAEFTPGKDGERTRALLRSLV